MQRYESDRLTESSYLNSCPGKEVVGSSVESQKNEQLIRILVDYGPCRGHWEHGRICNLHVFSVGTVTPCSNG